MNLSYIDYMNIGQENAVDPSQLAPLALAYVGDAVFEVAARTMLVNASNESVNSYNEKARRIVSAAGQSQIMLKIKELLTDEELHIYKRGRNAKSVSVPKNATVSDYRHATGFEALVGYLYLKERHERLNELLSVALQ